MIPIDIMKLYIAFLRNGSEFTGIDYNSDGSATAYFIWYATLVEASPIEIKFENWELAKNISFGEMFGCHPRHRVYVVK